MSLWPKLKVFDLNEDVKDVQIETSTQQNVLQETLDELKSLKTYIINLDALATHALAFSQKLDQLPTSIKSFVTVNINQESKNWAIEFNLFLNPLIKRAQTSLEECDNVANEFRTIGVSLAKLPPIVKPILSKVFSSYVQGLKMVRSVHLETVNQEYLRILMESSKKFQNVSEYTVDDLVTSSNMSKTIVLDVLDDYLKQYPNIGFINNKFVFITEEKLKSLSTKLESVKEKYFSAFNPNMADQTIKLVVTQIIKYYEFLIKGYEYLQYNDLAEKCSKEKKEFENILNPKQSILG